MTLTGIMNLLAGKKPDPEWHVAGARLVERTRRKWGKDQPYFALQCQLLEVNTCQRQEFETEISDAQGKRILALCAGRDEAGLHWEVTSIISKLWD